MSARTWWSAKADPNPAEKFDDRVGESADLPMDELLDARFDEEGRLSQLGRGSRKRVADRLDPRAAEASTEELEVAVQKLSQGLEAIERQGRAAPRPETSDRPAPETPDAGSPDFVTYSLDRLEARLEALSRRLQQRAGARTSAEPAPARKNRRSDPSLAVAQEEDRAGQLAEARRLAEAEAAAEGRREAEAAEARRRSDVAEARRQAELAEARRQSEIAEARRQAEMAEARRRAEAEAAAAEERRREAQ